MSGAPLDYQSFPAHSKEFQRRLHQSHYRSKPLKSARAQTDLDVLKKRHKFIRKEREPGGEPLSWEDQLAEKWYAKLFREFALIDLKHYKSGDIGLRWRTEDEVIEEIGERTCGGLRCENHQPAEETDLQRWRAKQERKSSRKEESTREYRSDKDARSRRSPRSSRGRDAFERQDDFVSLLEAEAEDLDEEGPLVCAELVPFQLNFSYVEDDAPENALVKVMLCKRCQKKLSKAKPA